MKLTVKQRKFADNYIETGNAKQSAIDAGYAKRSAQQIGAENLLKPVIKSYIDQRMQQIENSKVADAKEVLQYLTSVLRGEVKETIVVGGPLGAESVERPPDIKTRITAGKELLKRYPGNDKFVEQQIRKVRAEADIAEARVKDIKDIQDGTESTIIVDDLGDVDDGS
ncbi:phage terminase small subunit [Secundilactobacillus pentosiphilus]|uniref:Phage terminase small subunit n=1 Tax=Secundilactobacillus pentosiphilus TaxID=1714682 RepID=A0A1Z5IZC7_9LACO|nr:terminase small subunit [Secundilactobacillus pentosiphilus]GAX06821.1 phage terminase small subunit [Secundilactobacillus pentosiphilus]